MKPLVFTCACMLAVCIGHGSATASETIYRCGVSNTEYSHTPCSAGRPIEADDSRTESQRTEGRLVAKRMQALADSMEQERQVLEREGARSVAIGLNSTATAGQPSQRATRAKIKLIRQPAEKASRRPELTAAR